MIEANLADFNDSELAEVETMALEHQGSFSSYVEAYKFFYRAARASLVASFVSN